jgi:hypothetical protein
MTRARAWTCQASNGQPPAARWRMFWAGSCQCPRRGSIERGGEPPAPAGSGAISPRPCSCERRDDPGETKNPAAHRGATKDTASPHHAARGPGLRFHDLILPCHANPGRGFGGFDLSFSCRINVAGRLGSNSTRYGSAAGSHCGGIVVQVGCAGGLVSTSRSAAKSSRAL